MFFYHQLLILLLFILLIPPLLSFILFLTINLVKVFMILICINFLIQIHLFTMNKQVPQTLLHNYLFINYFFIY